MKSGEHARKNHRKSRLSVLPTTRKIFLATG